MSDPVTLKPWSVRLTYNAKLGLELFAVYLSMYIGFVGICAFDFKLMATPVIAGVNLAIGYGMGLIAAAVGLAMVYMMLCKDELEIHPPDETERT